MIPTYKKLQIDQLLKEGHKRSDIADMVDLELHQVMTYAAMRKNPDYNSYPKQIEYSEDRELIEKLLTIGVPVSKVALRFGYTEQQVYQHVWKFNIKRPEKYYGTVISPDGKQYDISSIKPFAIEHGLDFRALGNLLKGKGRSHKGWINAEIPPKVKKSKEVKVKEVKVKEVKKSKEVKVRETPIKAPPQLKGRIADIYGNVYEVWNVSEFASQHNIKTYAIDRLLNDNMTHFIISGFYNADRYQVTDEQYVALEPLLKPYLSLRRSKSVPFDSISRQTKIPFMTVKFYYCYFCELMKIDQSKQLTDQ